MSLGEPPPTRFWWTMHRRCGGRGRPRRRGTDESAAGSRLRQGRVPGRRDGRRTARCRSAISPRRRYIRRPGRRAHGPVRDRQRRAAITAGWPSIRRSPNRRAPCWSRGTNVSLTISLRPIGHYPSWRGARQALERTTGAIAELALAESSASRPAASRARASTRLPRARTCRGSRHFSTDRPPEAGSSHYVVLGRFEIARHRGTVAVGKPRR
jgi:hypothetical protein